MKCGMPYCHLFAQEVLEATAPKEPPVLTLPYVDKERAKQREEKALKVRFQTLASASPCIYSEEE
jgi:hypothetical protein